MVATKFTTSGGDCSNQQAIPVAQGQQRRLRERALVQRAALIGAQRGLEQLCIVADEAQRLTLHLPPEAFDWFAVDGTPQRTAGLYTIYVGLSQPDERSAELLQQRPCALCLEMFLP